MRTSLMPAKAATIAAARTLAGAALIAAIAIAGIAGCSDQTATPIAASTYEIFADVCLDHHPDAVAIDDAARAHELAALDPAVTPTWRRPPQPPPWHAEEDKFHKGQKRIWRRSPSEVALEVETNERKDGLTCAVSSNAKARDVATLFAAKNKFARQPDLEQRNHDLLKFALYQFYKLDEDRYVEIIDSPYDYDPAHPGAGVTITIMGKACVVNHCNALLVFAAAEAERRAAAAETRVPPPATPKLAYEIFADICLKDYPDTIAINDAARERRFVNPSWESSVWWREPENPDLTLGWVNDSDNPRCIVTAKVDVNAVIRIADAAIRFPRLAQEEESARLSRNITAARVYKFGDDRYLTIYEFALATDRDHPAPGVEISLMGKP